MFQELPQLEFLAIEKLILHEWHDDQRTSPLIERIRESGIFRNPPIVTPLQDGTDRYMVLDGANRFTALRMMGFPHILAQVVQPNDPGLNLQTWNHVVWGLQTDKLLETIRAIQQAELLPSDKQAQPELMGGCGLAVIQTPNVGIFSLCSENEALVCHVEILNALVDGYRSAAFLDRTNARDIDLLKNAYPDLTCLVVFPNFAVIDVLELAGAGYLLPTGITRFTVSPRVLHLNYPLYELAANKSLEEKNADLQEWVQKRITRKGIRYYAEATFLYDE